MNLDTLKVKVKEEKFKNDYDSVYEEVTNYFAQYPAYQFSGYNEVTYKTGPDEPPTEVVHVYSFDTILSYCIYGCLIKMKESDISNKELFEYAFDVINKYRAVHLNEELKNILSTYKMKIVVYYLLICLKRVQVPQGTKINNSYLSQKSRDYLRKRTSSDKSKKKKA